MKKISNCGSIFEHFLVWVLFLNAIFLGTSTAQERFRKNPPYPEPLSELNLPEIESATLSNGLDLSIVRLEGQPVIHLLLVIRTGESSAPERAPGMPTFTANMLNRGTEGYSYSKIVEIIESIGGSFSSRTSPDYSVFTFGFLEDYLDEALEILSRMLLQPTFPKVEVDNVVRIAYYDLLAKNSAPDFVAKRLLSKILFKNHPYSKMALDETASRNFDRIGLMDFFDKHYRPNNAEIILIGDITLQTAARKVSRYLNTWIKKDRETEPLTPPLPNQKIKICVVDLPGEKDATVYLGNIFLLDNPLDYFPLIVLNQVIGGSPHSRLFMNLRESKGYAYYAFSSLEFYKVCGLFTITERVRPEVISDSIRESLREIQSVSTSVIPNQEIEQAKSYLIGNFPIEIENTNYFSTKLAEIRAFNLGESFWNQYYKNLMLINADNVFEVSKKSFLRTPVVVVIGELQALSQYLRDFDLEIYDSKGEHQYTIKQGVLQ
ncbi:MAG: insulinase family protein [Candidatus Aminicenantes bacterium]|nr:insulinase family protein [Candidatus Aminicenantes bacterium]